MIEIKKIDFENAVLDNANNPIMQHRLIEQANSNELVILEEVDKFLAKVDEKCEIKYTKVLFGYEGISEYLNIPSTVALELIKRLSCKPSGMVDIFNMNPIFDCVDFDVKMKKYTQENGFSEKEASLFLGITINSFKLIKNHIIYNDTDYFLQDILEGFRNQYLLKRKTYSSNTSLVKDFVQGIQLQLGIKLDIQYCNICNEFVAIDKCYNENCNQKNESNFVCPKHSTMIDIPEWSITKRPKVLCSKCDNDDSCNNFKRF